MMNLKNVVLFEEGYKTWLLNKNEDKIDKGIRELCDTINCIDDLLTMNSCQCELYEKEKQDHCPITYVDFYVINHNYTVANNLFLLLIKEFGNTLNCTVGFEPDIDILVDEDGEEYVEDNGDTNMRYRIEFIDVHGWKEDSIMTMKKVVEVIREYNKKINYL